MAVDPGQGSQFRPSACSAGARCGVGLAVCHSLFLWVVLVEVLVPKGLEMFSVKIASSNTISQRMQATVADRWSIPAESLDRSYRWSMQAEGMKDESMDERRMAVGEEMDEEFPADDGGSGQWVFLDLGVRFGTFVAVVVGQLVGLWCYHRCYIRDTATRYIPQHAVTPPDMMGHWAFGEFDCFGEMGTCCCFLWCNICAISDLWYRAGFIHGITDPENPCSCCGDVPGWQYFVGGFLFMAAQFFGCLPCLAAFFRGGARWVDQGNGGMDTPDLRQRFGIKNDGFSTFCNDCLLWCCCGVCLGTQEYRQVMKLLDSGPLAIHSPPEGYTVHGNVVGAPVQVGNQAVPGQVSGVVAA